MVKITIRDLQNRLSVKPRKIAGIARKVLLSEHIKKSGEITFLFVNDTKIRALNFKYLGRNRPTDVIAFDVCEPKREDKIFADIAISTERAAANAADFGTSPLFELYLYVIHGMLHILGYDDRNKRDALLMRKKEKTIIKNLNLSFK